MNMKKMLLCSLLFALSLGQGYANPGLLERGRKGLLAGGVVCLVVSAGTGIVQRLTVKKKIARLEREIRKLLHISEDGTSRAKVVVPQETRKKAEELALKVKCLKRINTALSTAKFLGLGLGVIGVAGGVVGFYKAKKRRDDEEEDYELQQIFQVSERNKKAREVFKKSDIYKKNRNLFDNTGYSVSVDNSKGEKKFIYVDIDMDYFAVASCSSTQRPCVFIYKKQRSFDSNERPEVLASGFIAEEESDDDKVRINLHNDDQNEIDDDQNEIDLEFSLNYDEHNQLHSLYLPIEEWSDNNGGVDVALEEL